MIYKGETGKWQGCGCQYWLDTKLHYIRISEKCSAVQYSESQCSEVKCSAVQCTTVQCNAVHHNAVHWTVSQCTVSLWAVEQCSAVKCRAVQWCWSLPCSIDRILRDGLSGRMYTEGGGRVLLCFTVLYCIGKPEQLRFIRALMME